MFVNANSQLYTRQSNHCEFTLSAFESASGELESPRHTLPPKTVCRYHFQGRRHEIVWISFIKYHSAVDQSVFEAPAECAPQLRIWDGKLRTSNKMGKFQSYYTGIYHTLHYRRSVIVLVYSQIMLTIY